MRGHALWGRGTIYPHRRITVTVEHDTIGDDRLCNAWYEAMEELAKADPMGAKKEFVASNGLKITIRPAPVYDSPLDALTWPFRFRWRKGWGIRLLGGWRT